MSVFKFSILNKHYFYSKLKQESTTKADGTSLGAWRKNNKARPAPLVQERRGPVPAAGHPEAHLDGDGAFLGVRLQVDLHFRQRPAFRQQPVAQLLQGVTGVGDQLAYEHLREEKEGANAAGRPGPQPQCLFQVGGEMPKNIACLNHKDFPLFSETVSPGQVPK